MSVSGGVFTVGVSFWKPTGSDVPAAFAMPRKRRVELVTFGTLPVVLSEHIVILDYYIFLAFEIKKACLNLWVRERMEMDMKNWVWCKKPALEKKILL